MSTVEELGNRAYKKALFQDYKGAISILDKTIVNFPRDPRLYNNRSYCYCRLKDYKRALSDAEFMIKKFPTFSQSYYRKAEALIELKKYKEAENILQEFLKREPNCEEAKCVLTEVQITILCNGGKYWVHDAVRALRLTDNDLNKAVQFLRVGGRKSTKSYQKSDIYYSDGESSEQPTYFTSTITGKSTRESEHDPYTDPSNPFNSTSIWVGNVTKRVTHDKLKAIFGKYGKIKGDIIIHENSCAFVNYTEPKMAAAAMKKFQQHSPVEDTSLVIRYPQNIKTNSVILGGKKNGIKIR